MQETEPAPTSSASSPTPDEYATPGGKSVSAASETTPVVGEQNGQDLQLVVGVGRSIKNMFVDLMGVLEPQAKSKVFIQGEITLRVEGREVYVISLFNEDGIEPSSLDVKIDRAAAPEAAAPSQFPHEQSNGTNASANPKRPRDSVVDLASDLDSAQKRHKVDSRESEEESSSKVDATDELAPSAIMSKLHNVSAQIKWVEECRRIADEAHDGREETWRSTSATFHDDNRKARERHEAWVVQEMAWQRNMLIGLTNDVKGLWSTKWETPPQMGQMSPPPAPLPMSTAGQAASFVPYNSKPGRPKGSGAAGRASAAGQPIASLKPK